MHGSKHATYLRAASVIRRVLVVSSVAFLAACQAMKAPPPASPTPAAVSDTPEADRARLLTRVNAYWQARMQRDLKTTSQYELLSPPSALE